MASASEDDLMDSAGDLGDDLFGDDGDEGLQKEVRELSDRELDSGDDEDRKDRATKEDSVDHANQREARIQESTLLRHPLPKPADGEVCCAPPFFAT